MIRPVPLVLRILLALIVITVADTLACIVMILDSIIRWIMPEVDDRQSGQEGAHR